MTTARVRPESQEQDASRELQVVGAGKPGRESPRSRGWGGRQGRTSGSLACFPWRLGERLADCKQGCSGIPAAHWGTATPAAVSRWVGRGGASWGLGERWQRLKLGVVGEIGQI